MPAVFIGLIRKSSARRRAPIALSLKLCQPNPGSPVIHFKFGNSVRPMHLFGHTFDHDYYFELLY